MAVLVVDRSARLADVAGLPALLARGRPAGLTAICVDEEAAALPTSCQSVFRVIGVTGTRGTLCVAGEPTVCDCVVVDDVGADWSEAVARHLAPLTDGADASAIPDECSLLEVRALGDLGDGSIMRSWASSDGGAATSIGASADGAVRLDLVADGPHALVAGTTGAGKSELLQALVAGLAADHPPTLINFLLIDYKGGAAFAECAQLPHTAGLVTDLDPYLTARALRSLDSELRRRERLFAEAGVADLGAYRAARPPEALARLVIVVDEFAALAEELPDFVRGLVGVAQRGRSLGVHLVLATQRPGSAVSPEIRANTSLRIALRVTDPGESSDVLDAPDAAFLERSRPGRAYLRAGSTLTCFQTAHPGNTWGTQSHPVVEPLDSWRRPMALRPLDTGPTDLARLVAAVRVAHQRADTDAGTGTARTPWLAPLPDRVSRSTLSAPSIPSLLPIALVDLPDEQRRATMEFDLAAGSSLLIAGASRSGRTELLASLALGAAGAFGPQDLHVYVVDGGGALSCALAPLPHCATLLGPADVAMTSTLLRRLERVCADAVHRSTDDDVLSVLLIDGWENATSMLADSEAVECADLLATLLRTGPAAGLSIAVAGGRNCLAPRFAASFETKLVLRLTDATDYGMVGISPRAVPARLVPGRGLRATDSAVVHAVSATDEPGIESLRDAATAIARTYSHGDSSHGDSARRRSAVAPVRVRPLPRQVRLDDLPAAAAQFTVGVGGDDGRVVALDLFAGDGRFLVCGPPRSGRSTVLRSLLAQAARNGWPVAVAAPARSPLSELVRAAPAARSGVALVSPTDSAADAVARVAGVSVLLVDDCEAFVDTPAGDALLATVRSSESPRALVVAGRSDDLATSYRGVGAHVRRGSCGLLLRPGPVDGELLGVRLPRRPSSGPPGRGVLVGEPSWGPDFAADGEPLLVQVALPPDHVTTTGAERVPQPMWGYR